MKKYLIMVGLTLCLSCMVVPYSAQATPITVVITTVVKKVLRAMDLAIQRLQNETIRLQNAQKALENAMSKLKLKEIFEWTEKQKELFGSYYDELWKIKNAIAYYQRTKDIITLQVKVVGEYKSVITSLPKIKGFSPEEIEVMMQIYTGILKESIDNVDQLSIVVSAFKTQMSDAERLAMIHQAADAIQRNLNDLRSFTNQNIMLGMQRTKDKVELQTLRSLYNLPNK